MIRKITTTVASVAILAVGSFGFKDDHKPLNVKQDVISVSESPRHSSKKWGVSFRSKNEPQKHKFKKQKLRTSVRVNRFRQLAKAARYEAKNGGIKSKRHGDATPKMKWLVRQLLIYRFASAGRYALKVVLCIVGRESGFNPGAVSDSDDHGVGQFNRPWHPQYIYDPWPTARIYDPVYNIELIWTASSHGISWQPWTGTWGQGMCHY